MHVSIPPSSSIINKTHAELSAMATAGTLEPGQFYRITDFRTKHLIPNTTDYNTGPTEVLIVRAITASELAREAYSESYLQDIIYYELTDSSGAGGDRGRIFRRIDTEKQINVGTDWRKVKYRLWEETEGEGDYYSVNDTGFAYQDFYLFNDLTNTHDIYMATNTYGGMNELYVSVFKSYADSITARGSNFYHNVFGGGVSRIFFGGDTYKIVALDYFWEIIAGSNFRENRFEGGISQGVFGAHNTGNTVYAELADFTFMKFMEVTINTSTGSVSGMRCGYLNGGTFTLGGDGHVSNISLESFTAPVGAITLNSNAIITQDYSNFEVDVSITGLTTLDITAANSYAGIVNATSTNATETINLISNQPSWNYYEIKPASNLTLTLTGTAFASVNADGQILLGAATRVLNGAKRDSIKLRKETITNGNGTFTVAREVGVNISL